MRKFLCLLVCVFMFIILSGAVMADDGHDAIRFFKKYITAANSYSPEVLDFYSPKAKIIRQVIKPDGSLVDVETDTATYIHQLKMSQRMAKLKKYKNVYTNITSEKVANGYKVSSLRQPSGENYKLKTYMILQKQPDGNWLIVEELMQTKVQTFLRYAKR